MFIQYFPVTWWITTRFIQTNFGLRPIFARSFNILRVNNKIEVVVTRVRRDCGGPKTHLLFFSCWFYIPYSHLSFSNACVVDMNLSCIARVGHYAFFNHMHVKKNRTCQEYLFDDASFSHTGLEKIVNFRMLQTTAKIFGEISEPFIFS